MEVISGKKTKSNADRRAADTADNKAAETGKFRVSAVIFDLDGSLVDSMWMWKAIDLEFLSAYGLEVPDDLGDAIEGMSFTETASYFKETFRLPLTVEEIKEIWIRMAYEKYSHEVGFKPGAGEFVEFLHRHHIPMGIATSNSRPLVDAVLSSLGIGSYFHTIVTACEVNKGKPAPDIYLYAADAMQAAPSGCLVFEDVPAGILAGKAAGMHVIAVDDAFSEHLAGRKRELADACINHYGQVLACMEDRGNCLCCGLARI